MSNISELTAGNLAFGPQDIEAMSAALDAVCRVLNVPADTTALIALRIIELACRGKRSSVALEEHLLAEARTGSGC